MRRRNAEREALYESPAYQELLTRIGANVRRLREAKGWTQEECADRCAEMAPPLLRRIELASTNVTALTLARLADGLGVDAAELLAAGAHHTRRPPGRPRKASPTTPAPATEADMASPDAATEVPPPTDGEIATKTLVSK